MARVVAEEEVGTIFHLAAQTIVGVGPHRARLDVPHQHQRHLVRAWRPRAWAARGASWSPPPTRPTASHDTLPYTEDMALQPTFPYDVSKAATDLIARSYWHTYGLPVATTRFANIYGGGDLNPSRLIPELIAAALDGRAPHIRSDGTPERDFLLRRGRRRRLPGDRRRARRSRPGPGRPRRGLQRRRRPAGQRARGRRRARPRPRHAAGRRPTTPPTRRPARSRVSTSTSPRSAASAAGRRGSALEEGLRRTYDWYAARRRPLGHAPAAAAATPRCAAAGRAAARGPTARAAQRSNCAAGIGRARPKPCATSQPSSASRCQTCGVSTPSAIDPQPERAAQADDRADDRRVVRRRRPCRARTSGRA